MRTSFRKIISFSSLVFLGLLLIVAPTFALAEDLSGFEPGKQLVLEESATPTGSSSEDSSSSSEGGSLEGNLLDAAEEVGREAIEVTGGISDELLFAQFISTAMTIIGALCFLVIDIVLIGRLVMLVALTVASPIPFVLMILPATKKYANVWWQKFLKWAFVGVFITFFLWLIPATLGEKNQDGHWESKHTLSLLNSSLASSPGWGLGPLGGIFGLQSGVVEKGSDIALDEIEGITGLSSPKVIYPTFLEEGFIKGSLTGEVTAADYLEGFMVFFFTAGFMVAAAWTAITLGETAGKIALGTVRSIGRRAKKVAKGTGKLALKGAKAGVMATGVPGGVKQMWGEKMAPGRKTREARVAEALGMRGAKARDFSERTKKLQDQIKEAGTTAEQSGAILAQGQLPDGTKLDKYGAVAHLVNTASDIENYEDYVTARNRIKNFGGGEIELEQLRQGVDPFVRYNMAVPEGREEFEKDLERGKVKVDDLKNSRALGDARTVAHIAEKFGPGAVKKLETSINKNTLKSTLETLTTTPAMLGSVTGKTRAAAALVTEDVEKSFRIAGTNRFATDSLKDFVTKTTDPIALGKLKISAGVADQLHKHLTPNQLEALNADSFGNVSRVIKRDMDGLKDTHRIEKLEDLTPDNLRGTGYSFDLFNYIKKNKGKFNLS